MTISRFLNIGVALAALTLAACGGEEGGGSGGAPTPAAQVGTLAVSNATLSVDQTAGTATITVTRAGGSSGAASVSYTTANGTAVAGTNYTTTAGTLSWADTDAVSKTVSIPISNATPFGGTKSFTVTISAATGATLGTPAVATVTIIGSGVAATPGTLALGAATYTVAQTTANVSVTVTRTGGSSGAASVAYATANGTALAGAQYTATTGTLNWAAGDANTKTVMVPISNATPFTGTKTFTFAIATATGATLGAPAVATVTINGSGVVATPGTLAVGAATYTVAQTGGTVSISVTRSGGSSGAATVAYATANGTASSGTEYSATTGTLNWAAGDAATKTVMVPISNATPFTGSKTFTFTISGATGATLGAPAAATVTINGSAAAATGTLAIGAATYTVGQAAGTVSITVTRTGGSSGAATVTYATANGTALAGAQYTATTGTLSWTAADATTKTVMVPISNATPFTGSKAFTLTISGATGATLGAPAVTTVTINGSAAAATGTLAIGAATYAVGQAAGTVSITVTRTGGSSGAASVAYATANVTALAGVQYTATVGTLNWAAADAAAKTISVPISNATPFTGPKTFIVTIANASGAALGTPAVATVTINGSASSGGGANTVTVDKHMLVDQFGYRPNDAKVAVIRNPQTGFDSNDKITPGTAFEVRKASDGTIVFSGAITAWNAGATEASSGDKGWWFDFSTVTAPETYFIYDVQRNLRSPTFAINQQVYKPILKAATRMFFYQRSGIAKSVQNAGGWADGAAYMGVNQDTEARDVTDEANNAKRRDVSGGWFDAGDTNKYVVYAVAPVHQLLMAYQNTPNVFTDDFNIPESGNGIPDVVDEVKFEIDWLKRMQFTDGSVAAKVGTKVVENASPPSMDTTPRYYIPPCTSSTIATAGMFAHASYVYAAFGPLAAEAADTKTRAINAWNNYQSIGTKQTNCDTGIIRAGDADRSLDEQNALAVVAAIYLYAITGQASYHDYVKANFNKGYLRPYHDFGWTRYDAEQGEALLFYTTLPNADATVKAAIRQDKQNDVNNNGSVYGFNNDDLYRAYMHDAQYHWGSHQPHSNYGNTNVDALVYNFAGANSASISTRAVEILHYFHGVNPFGTAYLTNMSSFGATYSLNTIFHAWYKTNSPLWGNVLSTTFGPPPGYVPGGPNADTGVPLSPPSGQPRQKAYRDWNGDPNSGDPQQSWEITEPGIYYQSAYVKLISAFAQ